MYMYMGELVHGAFERRDVVVEVIALARKSAPCARDRRVAGVFDERAHGPLHVLRSGLAGNRARHGERRRVPARVLVTVVQACEDRL